MFMKKLILISGLATLAISLIPTALAGEATKYIGSIISDKSPAEYKSYGGFLIARDENLWGNEGVFRTSKSLDVYVIWLESSVERDIDGHAIFRAEDVLELPNRPAMTHDSNCKSSRYPKAFVIAVGNWEKRKKPEFGVYMKSVNKAWMVDAKSKKIREITPEGVSCEINEDRD